MMNFNNNEKTRPGLMYTRVWEAKPKAHREYPQLPTPGSSSGGGSLTEPHAGESLERS